ncbi:MAG: FAD-dependent oxidoreductase [Planctomycetota bacterium]
MSSSRRDGGDVAVLGAGIAGLSAATMLVERGLSVRLFDKARGPAGRISTRHSGRFDFDHGAQYFTVREDHFQAFVNEMEDREVVAEWRGKFVRVDERGQSLGPARESRRFVGQPGMNALAKYLAKDLDVRTQTRVAVATPEDPTHLHSEQGEDLGTFGRVLVTFPAGQAAEWLAQVEPELAKRVASVAMKPCRALLLGFESRVDVPFDGAFVEGSPLSWVARNSSKPGRPPGEAWVLHGSPEWSEENFDLDQEEADAAMEAAFRELCGSELPPEAHRDSHRWKYAIPERVLEESFLTSEDGKVTLCGDWCAGPRVEGAWLSGRAAAEHLLTGL